MATSQSDAGAMAKHCQKIETVMKAAGNKQGIIFIVGMSDAPGVDYDTRNMEDTFRKLDFAVFTEKNLHTDDMKALAKAIGRINFPKKFFYKYIAFYYTGHGGIDDNGKTFFKSLQADTTSKEYVYLENDIMSPITLGQKEKCLLFFLDCCMSYTANVSPSDGGSGPKIQVHPMHSNYFVAYAASFGGLSYGNKTTGGVWTDTLCKYLMMEGKPPLSAVLDATMTDVRKETTEQICSYENQLKEPINVILNLHQGAHHVIVPLVTIKQIVENMPDNLKANFHKDKWHRLGFYLGISEDVLEKIITECGLNKEKYLIEIYNHTNTAKENFWKKLETALRKINDDYTADEVRKYYVDNIETNHPYRDIIQKYTPDLVEAIPSASTLAIDLWGKKLIKARFRDRIVHRVNEDSPVMLKTILLDEIYYLCDNDDTLKEVFSLLKKQPNYSGINDVIEKIEADMKL